MSDRMRTMAKVQIVSRSTVILVPVLVYSVPYKVKG
jgi:hypothetical protein